MPELSRDEARVIGEVLDHFEKIQELLTEVEAGVLFPISLWSELKGGLDGHITYHESGVPVFRYGAPENGAWELVRKALEKSVKTGGA